MIEGQFKKTSAGKRLVQICFSAAAAFLIMINATIPANAASDIEIAESLATLLRASRAVISANQEYINDASIGDKRLTADVVIAKAKENYRYATGRSLDSIAAGSAQGALIKAELDAIRTVMDKV